MRRAAPVAHEISQQVERALLTWVYPQRKHLAQLIQAGSLTGAEADRAIERLTEAAAHTLSVARAGVWRIRPDRSAIDCIDLYERASGCHSTGQRLVATSAPSYFRALASERVIAASDALSDARTHELADGYLAPAGISSMLDAPVFVNGKAAAVVCHEQVGPARTWQFWEELVASTFADFVALVLEADTRHRDDVERRAHEEDLERQVAERTRALSESEQNLQALLDAAPIPLALVRASDHNIVYSNRRALALFDVQADELPRFNAGEFWVDQADRQVFLGRLLSQGSVFDAEVRLRDRHGRAFWARMDAQAMRFRGELCLLAGIADVTEQHQAREDLRTVFESAPVAMVVTRLGEDGALVAGNQRAADLLGVASDEVAGRPGASFFAEQDQLDALYRRVSSEGRVDRFEAELVDASGKRLWAELSAGLIQFDGAPAFVLGGSDITTRKRAQEALRRSESTLRALLAAAPNPLVVTSLDDAVVRYCNEPAARMFELDAADLVGRRAPDFYVDPRDRLSFVEALHRDGHVESFTARLRTSRNRPFWAIFSATTFDLEGESVFMCGFFDHSAQKELEDRLRVLATTDELTGVLNRRHFFEVGEAELHRASRYGHTTSVAMIDVDHFKRINDELGHRSGDAALRALGEVLRGEIRRVDLIARMGGEEFALLMPQTGLPGATRTLERIRRVVERGLASHGLARRITVSIGLAERLGDEGLGDLLHRADQCLYRAKAEGRNRVIAGAR